VFQFEIEAAGVCEGPLMIEKLYSVENGSQILEKTKPIL
jgi:hypothetical protein